MNSDSYTAALARAFEIVMTPLIFNLLLMAGTFLERRRVCEQATRDIKLLETMEGVACLQRRGDYIALDANRKTTMGPGSLAKPAPRGLQSLAVTQTMLLFHFDLATTKPILWYQCGIGLIKSTCPK